MHRAAGQRERRGVHLCHREQDTKVPCCGECPAKQGLEKEEGKLSQTIKLADRIKAVVGCFKPKLVEVQS